MVFLTTFLSNSFRTSFQFPNKNVLQWFPGHMGKGIKQMQQNLKNVDCIVEVHDARIPISGRNREFRKMFGTLKPHVLVLNKMDLADLRLRSEIVKRLEEQGINKVLFTNCKDPYCPGLNSLVPVTSELIALSDRFQRSENVDYSIMVIGVPNVGKSSLINVLRHKYMRQSKAAAVGAIAGVTRSVATKIKVSEVPLIYVLDTPGILEPHVSDIEAGFKLALCSSMQDHLVGSTHIADFLLYWLNKKGNFMYVDYMQIKEPCDNTTELLLLSAINMGKTVKKKSVEGGYVIFPDIEFSANYFIKGFRTGVFGKVMLDEICE